MTYLPVHLCAGSPALLLLLSFAAGAQIPMPSQVPEQDSEGYRISLDVNLVVLNATVRDRHGLVPSNLRLRDFEVYEDGVRQVLQLFRREDTPVTVGLVVDHSGSMRAKIADVSTAARTFVRFSNPEDEMFVVNFNENVRLGLPDGMGFTNRSEDLQAAILNAPVAGQTALYDAVAAGLAHFKAASRDKKVMIVISDGGDNASALTLPGALKMAEQSSAVVYAIGIFDETDQDQNPGVLSKLARATGGESFFPAEYAEVASICERIAHEIRNQYTLGYISTNASQPGTYRSIRVVVRAKEHGKLTVRTRAGYIASGERTPAEGKVSQ